MCSHANTVSSCQTVIVSSSKIIRLARLVFVGLTVSVDTEVVVVDIGVVDVAVHVNIIEHLRIALVFTEPSDLNITVGVGGCSCACFIISCTQREKNDGGILNVST